MERGVAMGLETPVMASLQLQDVTHQLVQEFMAELEDMLQDLSRGTVSAQQRKVLDKIIRFFDREMAEHHLEEEREIFPMLLSMGDALLNEQVLVLRADHEALRLGWQELKRQVVQMLALPGSDPGALYDSFARYTRRFAGHLVLEESIQFSPEVQVLLQRWDG